MLLIGRNVVHFEALHAHAGIGRDRTRDEGATADDGIFAHDGITAKNGGVCVNGYVVLNGGVTLFAGEALAPACRKSTESDTLVNLHVLAYHGGFANDDACAMIDKEVLADGCARMDIDARFGMGVFGHETRENGYMQKVKLVGDAVNRCRHKAWVGEDNFVEAAGSRVAIVGGVQVGFKAFANQWNLGEKLLADTVAFNLALVGAHGAAELAVIESNGHLLVEVVKGVLDNDRKAVLGVVNLVGAVPEMPRINYAD